MSKATDKYNIKRNAQELILSAEIKQESCPIGMMDAVCRLETIFKLVIVGYKMQWLTIWVIVGYKIEDVVPS